MLGCLFEDFEGAFADNYIRRNGSSEFLGGGRLDSIPPGEAGLVIGAAFHATFTGNIIRDNYAYGIYVNRDAVSNNVPSSQLVISDNTIVNNGTDGVWIDNSSIARYITFSGNNISENGYLGRMTNSIYAGIRVTSTGNAEGLLLIEGNVFSSIGLGTYVMVDQDHGAQTYCIASMDTSGDCFDSNPLLIAKDNTFDGMTNGIFWLNQE